jgi:hypothetical protein
MLTAASGFAAVFSLGLGFCPHLRQLDNRSGDTAQVRLFASDTAEHDAALTMMISTTHRSTSFRLMPGVFSYELRRASDSDWSEESPDAIAVLRSAQQTKVLVVNDIYPRMSSGKCSCCAFHSTELTADIRGTMAIIGRKLCGCVSR